MEWTKVLLNIRSIDTVHNFFFKNNYNEFQQFECAILSKHSKSTKTINIYIEHALILIKVFKEWKVYTGWPRKNATLSITNFKEIRHLIKLVSAVISRTFFFQQNDTKINDFDEGGFDFRAIFLSQCHFQNSLLLYHKSRLRYIGRNFFE